MPHFHHTVSGTSLPAEQTDQYIEDGGGMAPGARDLDVEAGSQSPAADTSLPEARAEDPPPGVPQDATAAPPRAGRGGAPVVVPMPFLALVLFTGALAVLWAADFFIFVGPELEAHLRRAESSGDSSRVYRDRQDRHVYYTNVLCFFLFVTVRGLMQLKPVWRRLQAARSGLLGPARRCASVAVVNGPLCLFTVSSVMLWTEEFFRAPRSAEEASDIQLSRTTLRMFSLYSLLVALLCCVVLLWSGLIRADAVIEAGRSSSSGRPGPAGCLGHKYKFKGRAQGCSDAMTRRDAGDHESIIAMLLIGTPAHMISDMDLGNPEARCYLRSFKHRGLATCPILDVQEFSQPVPMYEVGTIRGHNRLPFAAVDSTLFLRVLPEAQGIQDQWRAAGYTINPSQWVFRPQIPMDQLILAHSFKNIVLWPGAAGALSSSELMDSFGIPHECPPLPDLTEAPGELKASELDAACATLEKCFAALPQSSKSDHANSVKQYLRYLGGLADSLRSGPGQGNLNAKQVTADSASEADTDEENKARDYRSLTQELSRLYEHHMFAAVGMGSKSTAEPAPQPDSHEATDDDGIMNLPDSMVETAELDLQVESDDGMVEGKEAQVFHGPIRQMNLKPAEWRLASYIPSLRQLQFCETGPRH
ncbi:unnamed protein product [Prorocentrum cordatum]|uniref:Uncharacterized protein n=1 Tax=Prorocentrum cordatum TaxID=2364126 RepID=A0ABN9SVX2_9DINO|nr:unnamed protein product [Polarella glacialis]